MRLTALLIFLSISLFGQDVINLNDLAAKRVKSTTVYSVSDNTIDFKGVNRPGYWVKFTGTYSRSLHIKNFVGGELIFECTITTNTSDKTLKLTDCRDFKANGEQGFINGSGNSSGQLIYLSGKWRNATIIGFTLDQKRNSLRGSSPGGATVQAESYSDPSFSHGYLKIYKTVVRNANDEPFYVLYNQPTKAYLDTLIISETDIDGAGRDFWQLANVRYTLIENNRGTRGGLEGELNHVSGFSLNAGNKEVIIRNNVVTNIPQFAFSGGGGTTIFENNTFQQETAPGGNQGLYLRDGEFILKGNWFNANNSVRSVIGVDKSKVTWDVSNTFIGKQPFFVFTGGSTVEVPVVTKRMIEVIEEKSTQGIKLYYIRDGQSIEL